MVDIYNNNNNQIAVDNHRNNNTVAIWHSYDESCRKAALSNSNTRLADEQNRRIQRRSKNRRNTKVRSGYMIKYDITKIART